jgi:hypothetical protein
MAAKGGAKGGKMDAGSNTVTSNTVPNRRGNPECYGRSWALSPRTMAGKKGNKGDYGHKGAADYGKVGYGKGPGGYGKADHGHKGYTSGYNSADHHRERDRDRDRDHYRDRDGYGTKTMQKTLDTYYGGKRGKDYGKEHDRGPYNSKGKDQYGKEHDRGYHGKDNYGKGHDFKGKDRGKYGDKYHSGKGHWAGRKGKPAWIRKGCPVDPNLVPKAVPAAGSGVGGIPGGKDSPASFVPYAPPGVPPPAAGLFSVPAAPHYPPPSGAPHHAHPE